MIGTNALWYQLVLVLAGYSILVNRQSTYRFLIIIIWKDLMQARRMLFVFQLISSGLNSGILCEVELVK